MKKKVLLVVLLVALIGVFSFSRVLDSSAEEALKGNSFVEVIEEENYLAFEPTVDSKNVGLIFYSQTGVEKEAYSVAGIEFAQDGFTFFVLENGAGFEEANAIINDNTQIGVWAIGGHGEGGNTAAEFIESYPDMVKNGVVTGLVLWGSDASTVDLTDFVDHSEDYGCNGNTEDDLELEVLSIYGSSDGITTISEINNLRGLLPQETTSYVCISGGNNSNFANYGLIDGDKSASTSIESQQEIAFRFTEKLLSDL